MQPVNIMIFDNIDIFIKQDLARADLCIQELEAGEYKPTSLQWPWLEENEGNNPEKNL